MLLVSVMEMFSIGLVVPVIQTITTGSSSLSAIMPSWLPIDKLGATELIIAFVGLFVFKNIAIFCTTYAVSRTVQSSAAKFLTDLYTLYMARPLAFHHRHNSAELLRNLTTGTWQTFQAVNVALNVVLEICLVVAIFTTLLTLAPLVTLSTAAALGILGIIAYKVAGPVFVRWGTIAMTAEGEVLKWLGQSFAALRDIKLTRSYGYMADMLGHTVSVQALYNARTSTALQSPRLLLEIVAVASGMLLALIIKTTSENPQDAVTVLGLLGLAAMRLMPSLNRILTSFTELRLRTKYIDTLYDDVRDGRVDTDLLPAEILSSSAACFTNNISLRNIAYRYESRSEDVLHDVSLTIEKGESIGVVGPSGAGKSTLIDVVLGLLQPRSGKILLDGLPLSKDVESWQRKIGYVPQQIALFDDTLCRNIAFGIKDSSIDKDRVNEVVKLARLEAVMANLPLGLNTVVGERGVRLSGGQRQRIAIARALYRNPDLIVFDEATAALDNETEKEITAAIDAFAGQKTLLIIAHRLSTVTKCNRIVFMKDGRIAAVGSMKELLATNNEFRNFAQVINADLDMASSTTQKL